MAIKNYASQKHYLKSTLQTHCQRLFILLQVFLTISIPAAFAQQKASFPEFKPVSYKGFNLDEFKPDKEFLEKNPTFYQDGTYTIDSSLIKNYSRKKERIYSYFFRAYPFSSHETPAISFPVVNNLGFLNGNIQLYVNLPKESYTDLTEFHTLDMTKKEVAALTQDFGISNFSFHDPNTPSPSAEWDDSYRQFKDYHYHFEKLYPKYDRYDELLLSVGELAFIAKNDYGPYQGGAYPNCVVFALCVQDITGHVLRRYQQIIFCSAKEFLLKPSVVGVDQATHYLFPLAFKNLLGQLAKDTAGITQIKNHIAELQQLAPQKLEYVNYVNVKSTLMFNQEKKKALLANIEGVNKKLALYNASPLVTPNQITSLINGISPPQSTGQASAANGLGTIAAVGLNSLRISSDNNAVAALNVRGNGYLSEYKKIQDDEDILLKAQSPAVLKLLADDQTFAKDPGITTAFTIAQNNFNTSSNNAAAALSTLQQSYSKMLANPFGNKAETVASTAGGPSNGAGGTSSACSQQAETEWKQSAEYQRFYSTHVIVDGEYAKAKLARLTLQYCGDQLSPTDKAAVEKYIKDTEAQADNIKNTPHTDLLVN